MNIQIMQIAEWWDYFLFRLCVTTSKNCFGLELRMLGSIPIPIPIRIGPLLFVFIFFCLNAATYKKLNDISDSSETKHSHYRHSHTNAYARTHIQNRIIYTCTHNHTGIDTLTFEKSNA